MTYTNESTQTFAIDTSSKPLIGLFAWDGTAKAIGMAVDADQTRYIFYIGTDRALYYVTSSSGVNGGSWSVQETKSTLYWPLADEDSSDFAIASNPETYDIRIYYKSGGSLVQVSQTSKGGWEEAVHVPAKNTATVSPNTQKDTPEEHPPFPRLHQSNRSDHHPLRHP